MVAPRPFRFSLQAAEASSRREWIDLVRRAEDAGFDMVVTADHLGGCMAPLLPLATAAAATERLRLGVMVLNNDFHQPALLARDAATLDLLSDGRLELGLGAGHARPEYERAGLSFDAPAVRVARMEEALGILRRLFDGETVTHHGEHYRLEGERCDPCPVQAHLPLLVGGGGNRVLAVAASLADAVGFTGLGKTLADGQRHEPERFAPARVAEQVAHVRRAAGRRLADLEFQVLVQAVVVTDDPAAAAEDIVTRHPLLTVEDVLATPYLMIGTRRDLTDRLIAYRERWGFSHYTVRSDALGQIEPIIAELAGH